MDPKTTYQRPIIGVFVNKKFLRNSNMTLFARKLYQANKKEECTIYFFSPQKVDFKKQKIDGYILEGNRHWLEHTLPFPDIIYDRGTGFGAEKKAAEELRERFRKQPGISFINSCKLKKWQLHLKLSRHKAVRNYLPTTTFSHGIHDIREGIAKYGYLFLKSSGGSGGRKVFALEKCVEGYCFHFYHKGRHLKRHVPNLGVLGTELKKIGLKPDKVIIQQGIQLVKHHNRPLDLRVLMVKDKLGIWKAVYNQARVAQKGTVITNLSLGGEVMNYSDIYPGLKKRYPGIPSDKKIRKICKTIVVYIEKELGPFGEIGMDIGLDDKGKVWMLEANSKPSKLPEQVIEDTVGISPQFLMILQYARFLYEKKPSVG